MSEAPSFSSRWLAPAGIVVFAASCFLMAVLLMWLGRDRTFFYDEWDFVQYRGQFSVDALLANHNGHLSLFPVLGYLALRALAGPLYWPYLGCVVALHLCVAVLLYRYAKQRVGAALALVLALSLLTLGRAWQDLLWGFQAGFLGSLAAGLAAFWFLDTPGRGNERRATVCLILALGSSGLGIPMVLGVFVETLLRRGLAATARVTALPVVLYGTWYLTRGSNQADFANISLVPEYAWRSAEGAVGALLGVDPGGIAALATVVIAAAVTFAVTRRHGTARLAASLVAMLAFWSLTALSRGSLGEPTASRYLYPGALFLLLALIELASASSRRAREVVAVGLSVVVLAAAWSNAKVLRRGAAGLRDTAIFVKAELGALEMLGDWSPPGFQPDPTRMPQVRAGPYLAAIEGLGSPADDQMKILARSAAVRGAADDVILRVLRETGRAAEASEDGRPEAGSPACVTLPGDEAGLIEHQLLSRAIFVEAIGGAEVRLRWFRPDVPEEPLMTIPPKSLGIVQLPEGLDPSGWRLAVRSVTPYKLCTARVSD